MFRSLKFSEARYSEVRLKSKYRPVESDKTSLMALRNINTSQLKLHFCVFNVVSVIMIRDNFHSILYTSQSIKLSIHVVLDEIWNMEMNTCIQETCHTPKSHKVK